MTGLRTTIACVSQTLAQLTIKKQLRFFGRVFLFAVVLQKGGK
jgi:hypothetical protein